MPTFKLERYPFVCRLCLTPEEPQNIIPLDTKDECFEGGTIEDYLAAITFQVEEEKRHLFPRSICPQCLDRFRTFARYRNQVRQVHLLMNALAELRDSYSVPIKDLFESNTVRTMLVELNLCHKTDTNAEDLIAEFPQFQIAQLPAALEAKYIDMTVKVEPEDIEEIEQPEANDCPLEELDELKTEIFPETVAFEDAIDQDVECESSVASEAKPATKRRKYKPKKEKEPLQCPKCPYQTTKKTHYNSHQRTHLRREGRSIPCIDPSCTEKFANKTALRKHMEKAKHVACVCETCGRQCSSNAQLKEHLTRFHGNDWHACEYCQKTFKMRSNLQEHVKTVHLAENVFKCETCGAEFRRKIVLKYHQATHSDVYNFPCEQCDKKFKLKSLLHKHKLNVHSEASLECEHCRQMFRVKFKLLDHIEHVHGIRMRFFCDICLATSDSEENLAIHKARHENPKNMECGRCLTVFPEHEQVLDHVCITYREDYICCGRDLRYHVQYNKHMFLKHGVKINARVKPDPDALLGKIRVKRKRVLSCSKCKVILPTRTKMKQHQEKCLAGEIKKE